MIKEVHKADSRGEADHGWLKSNHSFSFGQYYNPNRMGFGKLRVLNDDVVTPGMGFPAHPHQNMEIVSIPLSGELEHKDSMGNESVIKQGEVQIMSAGTGVTHSEFNRSTDQSVEFLQIWVLPKEQNIRPRYAQIDVSSLIKPNEFSLILSPEKNVESLWINQDAYFSLGDIKKNLSVKYQLHRTGNGIYLFVLEGQIEIDGEQLGRRDAVGLKELATFSVQTKTNSKMLLMEIPL